MRSSFLVPLLFISSSLFLQAGNVQISNIEMIDDDPNAINVRFDIAWENSWRTSSLESNYDATWIFIKYRFNGGPWGHATLGSLAVANTPAGSEVIVAPDFLGAFVQRSSDGIGDNSYQGVELITEIGAGPDDELEICVFAIEMVYIPEGPFQLGDGLNGFEAGTTGVPYTITSEAGLTLGGTSAANLSDNSAYGGYIDDDFNSSVTQSLPAQYPKGFQAFYMMKYEISQGQYADFLNNLTASQKAARFPEHYDVSGMTIQSTASPDHYVSDTPERACNWLNWVDFATYADWSGLRPMSELEFEKACRGSKPAVEGEFAWGTNQRHNVGYQFETEGTSNEVIINPGVGVGNCIYGNTVFYNHPRRGGVVAASFENPNRAEAGASYYGVLELSGNVHEIVVSVGSNDGRSFDSSAHGDGFVNSSGVLSWPRFQAVLSLPVGGGSGRRGGNYISTDLEPTFPPIVDLTISGRNGSNLKIGETRLNTVGGRLVRSDF